MASFRWLAGWLLFAFTCAPALAHKVNIFAYVEGDSVHTESYFNDGRKCKNSVVSVYAGSGELLLQGATDSEGLFAFTVPDLSASRRGDLRIELAASMGHRAEYVLTRGEVWEEDDLPPAERDSAGISAGQEHAAPASGEMAQAVDQIVARRLSPLAEAVRRLEKQQERASLRDVIGGIGYIIGLMGLYYYLRSRSR